MVGAEKSIGLLEGRGVVVTGAGRGLGRAFALACAAEGARVVVNDVDSEEAEAVVAEIEAAGGRAIPSGHSVSDWEAAGELIESCVAEFGAIDGLVNNAVAYSYFGLPWEEDGAQARAAVEVNLLGQIFCGTQALRRMVARGAGSVVNLTSRAMSGAAGMATYCATKGGVASATWAWAQDAGPHGVRVNALSPGAVTRGSELAGPYAARGKSAADTPERVAPAAVYLLSDLARELSGQVVVMMGGRLSVLRRPQMAARVEEREHWTAAEIAATIEHDFGAELDPAGTGGRS